MTYEVGGASSPEDAFQRHQGHEWGYVLSGTLQVRIGFDEYVLEPGDAISLDSTIPHRLATLGDEPVEAIWFVLGRANFDAQGAARRTPGGGRPIAMTGVRVVRVGEGEPVTNVDGPGPG